MALLFCHGIHETKEVVEGLYDIVLNGSSVDRYVTSRHGTGVSDVPLWTTHDNSNVNLNEAVRVIEVSDKTNLFVGASFYMDIYSGNSYDPENLFVFLDSSGSLLFRMAADGSDLSFVLYDSAGTELIRSGGSDWTEDVWSPAITIEIVVSDTSGEVRMWVGSTVAQESTGINTGTTAIGQVGWGVRAKGDNLNLGVEDVWVDDANPHPDARIASLRPDANGNYQDWARSDTAVAAYTLVNDVPGDDTSYISSGSSGNRSTFDVDPVPSDANRPNVGGVMGWANIGKTDSTSRFAAITTRVGTTDYDGASEEITDRTTVREMWEQNPDTAADWTTSDVDGAEFGVVSTTS